MFDTRRPEETAAEISPTKRLEQMEAAAAQEEVPPLRRTRPEKKRKSRRKAKAAADKAEEKNPVKDIVDFMLPIVIAVILALLLKTLVFANAVVPSGSMLSTIEIGDRIVASRLAYITNDPQRYDVVIFKYPDDERQNYVKRIIGLPGETVEIKNGTVYVTQTNGKTIQLRDDFVTYCTRSWAFFSSYAVRRRMTWNWKSRYRCIMVFRLMILGTPSSSASMITPTVSCSWV